MTQTLLEAAEALLRADTRSLPCAYCEAEVPLMELLIDGPRGYRLLPTYDHGEKVMTSKGVFLWLGEDHLTAHKLDCPISILFEACSRCLS